MEKIGYTQSPAMQSFDLTLSKPDAAAQMKNANRDRGTDGQTYRWTDRGKHS